MTRILKSATNKLQSKDDLSSNLSINKKPKTIERDDKKSIEIKNEEKQKNDIWNISSIMFNIFAYIDHQDLIEFNAVCKKWNLLSNHIIHKKIKLFRNSEKKYNNNNKIDAEAVECISNNAKHAPFVKDFRYSHDLNPQRAIEVFKTFRFISNLTINHCGMSQDQFLSMISPLTQLRELSLSDFRVKKIFRNRFYKEAVQLPPTLKKLRLGYISYYNNPELFIQTLNSHSNLVEFSKVSYTNDEFLEPFYKHYPSLLSFEFVNDIHDSSQSLINIFECNPQLITLKLKLKVWNKELTRYITSYLTSLEELTLYGTECNGRIFSYPFLEFSQPTKIKKLTLKYSEYGDSLLNSIFINCPCLENLMLCELTYKNQHASKPSINLSKSPKIKKLTIKCQSLKISILESILINCPQLKELVVNLPFEWKEALKSIYETCSNLQKLEISPPSHICAQIRSTFSRELRLTDFFNTSPKFKSTLTHLALNYFVTQDSRADHYKYFEKLKSIKYPSQRYDNRLKPHIKPNIDMELWPGYKLVIKDNKYDYDVEFKKI